jgi:hypothetical protein
LGGAQTTAGPTSQGGTNPAGGVSASGGKTTTAANGTWTKLSVNGVTVTNGAPHIGVSTTTGTITVDDFPLVKN